MSEVPKVYPYEMDGNIWMSVSVDGIELDIRMSVEEAHQLSAKLEALSMTKFLRDE